MSYPNDRKYTESHEWVQVQGNVATMGITQFAADELTDITYVDLPAIGTAVSAGSPCGEIESVKATSEFLSAVDGKVTAVNTELADHPEWVNQDAYGKGWMVRVELGSAGVPANLMDAEAYTRHVSA
ncbi:MAG: glycine cleavage system protein GcvH [Phycisphaerae bacterium]|nr:glycine cleavage system protein GcvH [Phycisphaerae bacterium]